MVEQSLIPAEREVNVIARSRLCGVARPARARHDGVVIPTPKRPPMTGGPMLACRALRRRYGDLTAVDDVGFQISPGETYGLLGPNGAGKTTTISMVAGLLDGDDGEITVDGQPMSSHAVRAKAAIGYVPQDLAIYPDLSARENLMFFARLYGMSTPDAKRRSAEVLELTGLADRAGDQTKKYSGGMKRRLNIGIGLLHHPKLLILDEPTVGVDPQSRNAILESVEGLSGEGMAVLYTTHYMEEAERLCDRVGIIDHGKLIAEGTRNELVSLVGEGDQVRLLATGNLAKAAAELAGHPWVRQASATDQGIDVVVEDARSHLPEVLASVAVAGTAVRSVEVTEPDLEAVFLHLTGRALRD
jgi:ABC-2 type transport system ATP-binding protein